MASIEFITKRIEGKTKEIAKLEKKLERIEKAESTGWEVNPYYYSEYDKKYTLKDLEEARKTLEKYQSDLKTATEKAASRDVKAILTFLDNWKVRVRTYYIKSFEKYKEDLEEWYRYEKAHCDWHNNGGWRDPNRKAINEEYNEKRKEFYSKWAFIQPYIIRQINKERTAYENVLDTEKLDKDLKNDADAMYDDLIEKVTKITGKILDAAALEIGEKGELNGYIKGERGTAKVHTIDAGGWNIQRYHFRTLVHEV